MAEIAGFVGMSHSPFASLLPPQHLHGPGAQFLADAARVRRAVDDLAPDAVVVIGPDHFHGNFYDVMPPFVLGVETAIGFGDFGSAAGPFALQTDLAWAVHDGVTAAGFDLSLSYSLTVDHGIVQTYEMATGGSIPMIPLVVNTAAPPLPSLQRCVELGQALGAALRSADFAGCVLVAASGGLSHWLPSNDPRDPSVTGERRSALIHGRSDVQAFAAAREPRVRAMGGNPSARVDADWDRWFLDRLAGGDAGAIAALGHEGLEEAAGTGGHEVRCWLTGQVAAGLPLVWHSYEPVPEWITGMGIGTTFPVP
ncbi:DODA-type extradiol aromatic ring-opening family dioxygenase [Saccharopolyspora phatthalungensis]|uniref:2,3-dihydroxyphenylpropionate 1,2-dioxygenase n=1 Tax=Saccharopolyspora phatthalungensis TaxID=664693 RepID=A0A840Q8B1_9PSEU|nr:2,3-dihydroxyphenylpropionate 1,2-dioxygenase [Saccharopolyspora phatthalungensis]MBB5156964.1 2,3-dihydroxyphenylpropionate 1,2-dioxygenase [Saccharopolyspora phatthalungensis]